ncbi:uncharacterized protein TNCV_3747991 [Trichonephila clavipes]|nr:uncharacterized protein TNCV_3747991 [Trichonephila clavipes]
MTFVQGVKSFFTCPCSLPASPAHLLDRWGISLRQLFEDQDLVCDTITRKDSRQEEEPMDWEDVPFLSEVSASFVTSRPPRKMRSLISVQVSEPSSLSANRFPNMRALVPKWVLFHLGIDGNKKADFLARTADEEEVSPTGSFTFSELSSLKKIGLLHLGRIPLSHPWYFGRNPGGLF